MNFDIDYDSSNFILQLGDTYTGLLMVQPPLHTEDH